MSTKILYERGGIVYSIPEHNYKEYWISYERGVKEGDCRFIDDKLFVCWNINKRGRFKKPSVHWKRVNTAKYLLEEKILIKEE